MKFKKMTYLLILMSMIFSFFAFTPDVALAADDAPPVDPYTMPWCLEHEGCHRFGIKNQTDSWLQVYTTNLQTSEKKFFTIRSGDTIFLKGRPGSYMWDFVWWCSGEMDTWHVHQAPLNSNWVIRFRCPGGFAGGIYR